MINPMYVHTYNEATLSASHHIVHPVCCINYSGFNLQSRIRACGGVEAILAAMQRFPQEQALMQAGQYALDSLNLDDDSEVLLYCF